MANDCCLAHLHGSRHARAASTGPGLGQPGQQAKPEAEDPYTTLRASANTQEGVVKLHQVGSQWYLEIQAGLPDTIDSILRGDG